MTNVENKIDTIGEGNEVFDNFPEMIAKKVSELPAQIRKEYIIQTKLQERSVTMDANTMTVTQHPATAIIEFIPVIGDTDEDQ